MNSSQDSPEYIKKKSFLKELLTIYGRKPVLEALKDNNLNCYKLHLAESNKPAQIIKELIVLAKDLKIEIVYHDRLALSRISKNSKQDQGVCLDIHCPTHADFSKFLQSHKNPSKLRLIALDRITNPQNMGMIIRSACAGNIDGILIADKGSAKFDSLVIKASAGTLFKAPILRCNSLNKALESAKANGADIVGLAGNSQKELSDYNEAPFVIYVLGNETEGISNSIKSLCNETVFIPMNNQVESLNVAVTASLLSFRNLL